LCAVLYHTQHKIHQFLKYHFPFPCFLPKRRLKLLTVGDFPRAAALLRKSSAAPSAGGPRNAPKWRQANFWNDSIPRGRATRDLIGHITAGRLSAYSNVRRHSRERIRAGGENAGSHEKREKGVFSVCPQSWLLCGQTLHFLA
jgi:hypothetical protein